ITTQGSAPVIQGNQNTGGGIGINYIRFVGIEVTSNSVIPLIGYGLGSCPILQGGRYYNCGGGGLIQFPYVDGVANINSHVFFDRSYIHGSPTIDVEAGIYGDVPYIGVVDSYISDIHY